MRKLIFGLLCLLLMSACTRRQIVRCEDLDIAFAHSILNPMGENIEITSLDTVNEDWPELEETIKIPMFRDVPIRVYKVVDDGVVSIVIFSADGYVLLNLKKESFLKRIWRKK